MFEVSISSSHRSPIYQTFDTEDECREWAKKKFCLMVLDGHHVNIRGVIINTVTKELITLNEPNVLNLIKGTGIPE